MANTNSSDEGRKTVLPTDEARQAVTGHGVRYVLTFGLAGVIIAFVIVLLLFIGRG
jgi:hypothetical protein